MRFSQGVVVLVVARVVAELAQRFRWEGDGGEAWWKGGGGGERREDSEGGRISWQRHSLVAPPSAKPLLLDPTPDQKPKARAIYPRTSGLLVRGAHEGANVAGEMRGRRGMWGRLMQLRDDVEIVLAGNVTGVTDKAGIFCREDSIVRRGRKGEGGREGKGGVVHGREGVRRSRSGSRTGEENPRGTRRAFRITVACDIRAQDEARTSVSGALTSVGAGAEKKSLVLLPAGQTWYEWAEVRVHACFLTMNEDAVYLCTLLFHACAESQVRAC